MAGMWRRAGRVGLAWAGLWFAGAMIAMVMIGVLNPGSLDPGEGSMALVVFAPMALLSGAAFATLQSLLGPAGPDGVRTTGASPCV